PLDKNNIKSIAVIGPLANVFIEGGYSGVVKNPVTPLQGIKKKVSKGTKVLFAKGVKIQVLQNRNGGPGSRHIPFYPKKEFSKAAKMAGKADAAIVFIGTTSAYEREG